MTYSDKFCSVCLHVRQKLVQLTTVQENSETYYDKLSVLFPEMNMSRIKEVAFICYDCKKCTDIMFNFRTTCLRNNVRLQKYISQLNLHENDIEKINSQLILIKQKMENPDDVNQPGEYEQNFVPFENILITECKEEFDVDDHIKKEVMDDDDVIDQYPLEHVRLNNFNINSETKTGGDIDPISVTNDIVDSTATSNMYPNVIKSDIPSLHTEIDIDTCMKNEMSDECIGNKSVIKERSSDDDNIDTNIEFAVDNNDPLSETCGTNVNKPFESNTDENISDDNKFLSEEDFNKISNYYNLPSQSNETVHNEPLTKPKKTVEKLYKCEICNKCFDRPSLLKIHNRIHTGEKPYECEICNKAFKQLAHLTRHKRNHSGEKPYKCEICQKTFTNPYSLKEHDRIHTGEKPFECEICKKTFRKSAALIKHNRIHTGVKPYECEICNKTFNDLSNLNHHNKSHTGEKPFKCETCHKTFTNPYTLREHDRIHTGEKPFECEICHKTFRKSSGFRKHMIIHSGIKPYKCEICNKSFNDSSNLNVHSRIHTGEKPFECDVCHKKFTNLRVLQEHHRIHTGEKPYKCEICNKDFTQLSHIISHKRKHSGEKLYKCEICKKEFVYSSSLTKHVNLVHNIELNSFDEDNKTEIGIDISNAQHFLS